jgi:SAM-dependent methyltransferase
MVASLRGEWRRAVRRLSRSIVYRAPGERDVCPACGSPEIFELDVLPLRGARTGFVCACDGCGLVFSNPLPSSADLTAFYGPAGTWAANRPNGGRVPDAPVGAVGGSWTRMFEPIRAAVDVTAPPAGARVLDFGCGDGKLLDLLQNCGWQTFGIEPALDSAFGRHGRLAAVPETPTFDLIVLIQVMEHVANPLQLLQQLARATRIGGHLLVSVPRFDTLPVHRDYRYVLNGRAHITAYTWACLRTLLARAGWEPVAPPPIEISKGGGRRTTSRLRVLARRVDGVVAEAEKPADEARAALQAYYAHGTSRPLLARAGLLRLAARKEQWHRSYMARKTAKQAAASGSTAL